MEALERERQAANAAQQRALAEHFAELEAERQRQSDLATRLNETQVRAYYSKHLSVWSPARKTAMPWQVGGCRSYAQSCMKRKVTAKRAAFFEPRTAVPREGPEPLSKGARSLWLDCLSSDMPN